MAKNQINEQNARILLKLEGILNTIDELFENPIFIDGIDGEQELRLDTFCELIDSIIEQFTPSPGGQPFQPLVADDSFDAD